MTRRLESLLSLVAAKATELFVRLPSLSLSHVSRTARALARYLRECVLPHCDLTCLPTCLRIPVAVSTLASGRDAKAGTPAPHLLHQSPTLTTLCHSSSIILTPLIFLLCRQTLLYIQTDYESSCQLVVRDLPVLKGSSVVCLCSRHAALVAGVVWILLSRLSPLSVCITCRLLCWTVNPSADDRYVASALPTSREREREIAATPASQYKSRRDGK